MVIIYVICSCRKRRALSLIPPTQSKPYLAAATKFSYCWHNFLHSRQNQYTSAIVVYFPVLKHFSHYTHYPSYRRSPERDASAFLKFYVASPFSFWCGPFQGPVASWHYLQYPSQHAKIPFQNFSSHVQQVQREGSLKLPSSTQGGWRRVTRYRDVGILQELSTTIVTAGFVLYNPG